MGTPKFEETSAVQVVNICLPGKAATEWNGFYLKTGEIVEGGAVYRLDAAHILKLVGGVWSLLKLGKVKHRLNAPPSSTRAAPKSLNEEEEDDMELKVPPTAPGIQTSLMSLVTGADFNWDGYYFPAGDTCEGALRYQ